jgi:signal transduction histidine kinase
MHGPIMVEGAVWGRIAFRWTASEGSSASPWTTEEVRLLEPLADQFAAWVQRTDRTVIGPVDWETQKDGSSGALPDLEARQLQRRVESQRALVEASRLLVSPGEVAMDELLRIVGQTTGADYAYLLAIRPEDGEARSPLASTPPNNPSPIDLDAYAHYEWHAPTSARPRQGHPLHRAQPDARDDSATLAVPLLSRQHLLFGYLGIEFDQEPSPLTDEDVRLLNVLGDMLSAFLQRQITDRALRESERRYRHFVATISEAIWRIDLKQPVAVDQPPDALAKAVAQQGVMAECNSELARLFGATSPDELVGWSVSRLTEFTGQRIVRDAVEADFRLQAQEYVVYDRDRNARHFIVNTSGVVEGGQLRSVWGSTTEVTARVQLERRMVTALEQQQQRIGRDLHDSVGQLLTGVRMLAQNLEERHVQPGTDGHPQIQSIINYADEAAKHVSDLQRGLMPVQMERAGLAQALQELAGNTDVLPDVSCSYDHDGSTDVHAPETKLQLYRIAQEATNNALKHAEPSEIVITLTSSEGMLHLRVNDDGMGFDVAERATDSLGLHSMHYRARAINAELDVQSTRGSGTTVHCRMNLHDRAPSAESDGAEPNPDEPNPVERNHKPPEPSHEQSSI